MKNKEIERILNEIKDKERDYVGTNGCLYQDLERKELNLLSSYIEQLEKEYNRSLDKLRNLRVENEQLENNRDKAIEYIEYQKDNPQYDNVWRKYECESLIDILKGGIDE